MLDNFRTLKFDLQAVLYNNNKILLNNNNNNSENNINKTAIIVTKTYQGTNNNNNIFVKILFYINRVLLIQLSNRQSDITEPLPKGISIHCYDIKQ